MEALRNSIQDQQQTEAGSKFINEDKPQKDAYQAAVQNAKDLINQTNNPTLDKAQVEQLTQAVNQAKDNLHGDQKLADDKQHAVTDLNQLNGLNNPQRQALESQINNAATRGEVAQKLAEAKALDQAMQALRNSIQDQQQTESGSKFINEDKPQKDAYQAAVQNAKDLINQTGNPTLDKSQVEQLTQAVTTAKDNLHGDQKLARDQQQAVTTVNALPNLNHAQQQALTDAINAAPTRTEVAQHVQTATELDHAMETLKNKVDQVNTDKAQPNYTEASTDKKEAVDQALQAAESITDPTNGSNANKDAVDQVLTNLQEKENELNGNERVAEAKTQAKQTIDQLTHLNADQIATAKQNIDQATKLQPIAELVDQATQLNQSMDQLQQAVNEHANVEQTVDYTQADSDKQNAYKQAIADAENVLKQNANKQQVDQALQNILNAKQALNGDERVALAKTNGKHDIDQLNALNNAQQDGFKGRIDQSNDLNQIQQIVDEAKALNRAMDQLSQEITDNEGRTKGSTNYVNADTQVKQVYDETVDKAKQALDKSTGQNLTAKQVIKLNDAVTAAKKALNGEERLNNRKAEALQRLDQLTHLNNAQRQLAIQQINNAETLNKASRAINRATKLDNAMGAVQQYIDEQHLGVISSTNYINADDNLKANYDNAIANAAHELDKVQGNAIAKAEAEQLKQNIIDAQNALNGDQNLANAKDKANAFVNSLNGLNQQQQDLAHKAINNADTVSDVTDIVNNQIDLNDAMETLKHLVDNEIPNAEQTVNYQNADDNAKTNFDDAKRLANTLLNSDNTNVNDINGAIQAVNDAIHNLNGDQRLQDAKDKAIQSINQALANKLKEIEASNATDQDKLIAKNKAEELANSIINNINKATSNQAVSQVQTAGNHAIEQVHANEIPKAKIDANKDVDKQVQALIDEIDRNPNLTDKEKQALKDRINQILQQGHNGINNAMTKEEIEQAKAQLAQALQDIKDLVKAKEDAKQDVDKQVQALIDEIDQNPNLTDKEKQALKDRINQILQQGHNDINNALTKEEIEQAKAQLAQALQDIKDLVKAKEDAKNDIDKRVQALIDEIDQNPNLTDKEKQALKDRINQILQQGHNDINNALTKEAIEQAKARFAQALQDIKDLVKAKEDAKHDVDKRVQALIDEIDQNPNLTDKEKQALKDRINQILQQGHNDINNALTKEAIEQAKARFAQALQDIKDLVKAKEDAKHDVDKRVQALIDEIDQNPNLTDKEKQALKDRINQILQQGHNGINNAMTKEEIEQAKAQLAQALQDIKDLVKAKEDAKQDVDKQVQALIDEIDQNPNLTDKEKQALKDRINQILQQGHNDINNAMTKEAIEQAKERLAQALQDIKDLVKAKEDAKNDIDKRVQALIDEIDQNPNLTDKEKQALKDRINQILQQGHNDINNALTKEEIEQAKAQLAQALQDIKDLVKAKEDAKNAIKALANAKRDQINSNPDLTPEQKAKALKEIDEAEKRALQNVENAQTIDQLNRGLNLGLDDIRNTHVWEVDEQPAVNEIFEATPEQILVNGELIVHRDDIITEQDILAHINLIDQLSAEVIDTPSTATISDSLTAKVEVTLLDGSKVIVNVPVKVVEKELSVVKQQAIESIENAAQQKINEINNSVTLTLEQKEAAIAEVNKLKQQAIDHVNNAPDVHSVEEIQQQEQAHIEQFNPEQFTIEQAKSNAIKSIEDAIQHMIDEIKARTDLTDKEKQEAIAKLNQLKEQAIQAIQRAQSIDEISEQLEQFKAQMKAANPTAKELAKRKQEAISRIKDFSNEKINSIRNSEIGTADEKQAAMNQINEIVLETIRDINNAHTLQQVEAALNNGIARISAVQIVTSDRAKQSSSTGNESNSHLTIGYGTANHPFNSSTIGHKKKLDEDDDIDPLHMRHFSNNFGNVIKNAIGVVGISGLLASFWFFIAKRRRKEDEEEELEIRDNNKDSIKETLDDTKHLPLLFAKRRRKEDEEDVTVEEKDSLNNGESLDKVKHTPFFLPKRRRKEDEEDVEVTNENTDEKVLKDNEHSPLLFAKRRKDKEEDVETTTSIESKDEDVPLLLAKKKNQKDNQSKDKKSASKNTSKKVAAKKKKKKAKKNKK
ncbi:extracellular matrix-binding protein ebh [Staphylococcus aureus M0771]|nr:extracellular matrix-binding protein ebh [Staphylococcus aureus M0771]